MPLSNAKRGDRRLLASPLENLEPAEFAQNLVKRGTIRDSLAQPRTELEPVARQEIYFLLTDWA